MDCIATNGRVADGLRGNVAWREGVHLLLALRNGANPLGMLHEHGIFLGMRAHKIYLDLLLRRERGIGRLHLFHEANALVVGNPF